MEGESEMLMDEEIIIIYCLCDDFLKMSKKYVDPQEKMSDSEVMTTALVAALYFGGNFEKAISLLKEPRYIPNMLSRSRFNRRLHKIKEEFITLFDTIGLYWKNINTENIYIIDSFPISVCDNCRISRAKIYRSEAYRGNIASKKRYFYGVRIHMIVTKQGQPVEFFVAPGSFADVSALKVFNFDLPENSTIYGDKAYNNYVIEDIMLISANIKLLPIRKNNSLRPLHQCIEYIQRLYRKMVEVTGSIIERILPKSIHAVTAEGFELKVILFVLACSMNYYLNSL